ERCRRARNMRPDPLFAEPLGVLAHSSELRFPGALQDTGALTLVFVDDEGLLWPALDGRCRGLGDERERCVGESLLTEVLREEPHTLEEPGVLSRHCEGQ